MLSDGTHSGRSEAAEPITRATMRRRCRRRLRMRAPRPRQRRRGRSCSICSPPAGQATRSTAPSGSWRRDDRAPPVRRLAGLPEPRPCAVRSRSARKLLRRRPTRRALTSGAPTPCGASTTRSRCDAISDSHAFISRCYDLNQDTRELRSRKVCERPVAISSGFRRPQRGRVRTGRHGRRSRPRQAARP